MSTDLDKLFDAIEKRCDSSSDEETKVINFDGLLRSLSESESLLKLDSRVLEKDTCGWESSQIDPYYLPKSFGETREINFDELDIMALDPDCTSESRVLVLYTGGTIGMKMKNGSYQPESNYLSAALRKLPMFHDSTIKSDVFKKYPNVFIMPRSREGRRIIFVIYEYDPIIDSCDITMDDYIHMAKDIESQYDCYEGFVILHGTDTMGYTASCLSFILENLAKPVIITGSQIPVFEIRSDGRENLLTSLMLAGHYQIPEVSIFFHEKLLRGNRTSKVSSVHFEAFESPNYSPLANLGVEIIVHTHLIREPPKEPFSVSTNLCPNVSILRMFPSITIQTLTAFFSPPIQGVVVQNYGAGNVPLSRKDILQLFKTVTEQGVIIVSISQCWRGGVKSIYRTGSILAEYGVISGMDMTPEAALLKLSYVLGKTEWPLKLKREAMMTNLCGEVTLPGRPTVFSKARRSSQDIPLPSLTAGVLVEKKKIISAAMCAAAQNNDDILLRRLGTKYSCWEFTNAEGILPLQVAISYDRISIVKILLQHYSIENINKLDVNNKTPLFNAVMNHCNLEIIDALVNSGALIDSQHSNQVKQQVLQSVRLNQMDIVRRFHAAKYNFNVYDSNFNTPLHLAVIFNYYDMVLFFVETSSVNLKSLNGLSCTAEDEAYMHNHSEIALILSRSSIILPPSLL